MKKRILLLLLSAFAIIININALKRTNCIKVQREEISICNNWKTWLLNGRSDTINICLPHNWDDYYGYRQYIHGNLHGSAIYQNSFTLKKNISREYFIRLEGVGTYANIKINEKNIGRFISGRTTITLDITPYVKNGKNNIEIKAEHPELISDMPWVCGGCSSEWGFCEGSQPFGIFRPVVLETTDKIRIEPYGVHIWNSDNADSIYIETEVKNYGFTKETVNIQNQFYDADGNVKFILKSSCTLKPNEIKVIRQNSAIKNENRWSHENPYLYNLVTEVKILSDVLDAVSTPFGIRTISWPVKRKDSDGRFYINNKPFFINGVAEYEHLFGSSHAFSSQQIASRVKQILSLGFNAFRDAHQPHNLEYQKHWDKNGILFWPQFTSHIWYDSPEFRENFKMLLRQWVKERRNSPSVIMWGLENESSLPKDFAEECSEIIREMDPTAKNMRIITTCNGGVGTDWNVIQNWSGTYGGNLNNYGKELMLPNQLLNGEYGAWRTMGFHTEPQPFNQDGSWSEERMCQLMETKVRLAESVKDSVCGQFQWIYNTHDNPGRRQPDGAYRMIDKIGPVNYKGIITPWEEPSDVFYMYKSNYVSASKEPFVYLSSHTWNYRFKKERNATIEAYSNCDSIILYNSASDKFILGNEKKGEIGTHFSWKDKNIKYNVLHAVGYYQGKPVCEDYLISDYLPKAPDFNLIYNYSLINRMPHLNNDIKGRKNYTYLYRLNCGGDSYTDTYNQKWIQDNTNYSSSWSKPFIENGEKLLSPYQASQRFTNDPIYGTKDWKLFQRFRFGRNKLDFKFPVKNGKYMVEFYFIEPWHGTGCSKKTNCEGLRIFDVAINDRTVIKDLDIWKEAGHDNLLKKVVFVDVRNGEIKIDFPVVKAGQAVISAIAIAQKGKCCIGEFNTSSNSETNFSWEKENDNCIEKTPENLLPIDKITRGKTSYNIDKAKCIGCNIEQYKGNKCSVFNYNNGSIEWTITTGLAQVYALRFTYLNNLNTPIKVNMKIIDPKGIILKDNDITFMGTSGRWQLISTTTGGYINAGTYRVILSGSNMKNIFFSNLDVQ